MRNYQNAGEIRFYSIDSLDEASATDFILRSESFINDEALQFGSGTPCQKTRKGQPDGKIDFESFPTAIKLVISGADLICYHDLQCFARRTLLTALLCH